MFKLVSLDIKCGKSLCRIHSKHLRERLQQCVYEYKKHRYFLSTVYNSSVRSVRTDILIRNRVVSHFSKTENFL